MTLNHLLEQQGLDVTSTLVLRHRPTSPELRKQLPWLAAERPDVFNAYQQQQGDALERVMQKLVGTGTITSFIGHEPGRAVFVGVYSITGARAVTEVQLNEIHAYVELSGLGSRHEEVPRPVWFDLDKTPALSDWQGKLIVKWPPPERSWWRRAHRNEIPVAAILEESLLTSSMPPWNELELSWADLALLPASWRAALSHWRGIYFIFDESDGKGYVGSAYGTDNILGRWRNYAARGHGGNVLLRARRPERFLFSILERVSPDMSSADVIALEASWKRRLHTRHPSGLNDN